jgi:hypothetical protein
MITKDDVRQLVHTMLAEQIEAELLYRDPDTYYGWVAPAHDPETGRKTPGYWIGQSDIEEATYQVHLAEHNLERADNRLDPTDPASVASRAAAAQNLTAARQRLDEATTFADRMAYERRQQVINRRVAKRFLRYHRKALVLDWKLHHPSIPESLRNYTLRQLARKPIAPTSLVFLYLIIESTREHGADFQTESLTTYNYLADNPLAVAALDIDVPENAPSKAKRAYIRELQAEAIRERQEPAHANRDPRDVLADFEYHGLPEQLGAMWINKDDNCCDQCRQGLRVRMIHSGSGYRYAKVCPNYRQNAKCHYETLSPVRETRKALKDWATVEWAADQAQVA